MDYIKGGWSVIEEDLGGEKYRPKNISNSIIVVIEEDLGEEFRRRQKLQN